MGGTTGATLGAALGGAGGAAVASDKRHRTESAIGGALVVVQVIPLGKNMGGTNGGYIGSALGAAGGAALGNKISKIKNMTAIKNVNGRKNATVVNLER